MLLNWIRDQRFDIPATLRMVAEMAGLFVGIWLLVSVVPAWLAAAIIVGVLYAFVFDWEPHISAMMRPIVGDVMSLFGYMLITVAVSVSLAGVIWWRWSVMFAQAMGLYFGLIVSAFAVHYVNAFLDTWGDDGQDTSIVGILKRMEPVAVFLALAFFYIGYGIQVMALMMGMYIGVVLVSKIITGLLPENWGAVWTVTGILTGRLKIRPHHWARKPDTRHLLLVMDDNQEQIEIDPLVLALMALGLFLVGWLVYGAFMLRDALTVGLL